jgi:hypothetical protein
MSARFSIAALAAAIVLCGVGLAALRDPSEWWTALLFTATAAALPTAVLGAMFRRGEPRAFWAGFASFGVCYASLVYAKSSYELLVTTRLLSYLHASLPDATRQRGFTVQWNDMSEWSFIFVGHLLVAWAAALIGGFVARRFHGTRGEAR